MTREAFKLAYDGRAAYGNITSKYGKTLIIDGVGIDQCFYFVKSDKQTTRYMDRKMAVDAAMATDPPVSEAQRKAMGAAMSGHSTLGIPKSVGKEFIDADPGGKLPQSKPGKDCMDFKGTSRDGKACHIQRAADMSGSEWDQLQQLLGRFFEQERQEPSHDGGGGSGRQPLREECPGGSISRRLHHG